MCFDDFAGVAMLGYYLLGDARAEQVCCVSPVRVGTLLKTRPSWLEEDARNKHVKHRAKQRERSAAR